MKKFIIMIGLLAINLSFTAKNSSLKSEIMNKVSPDLSKVELDQFHQDFVVVSFSIKDNQIKIIEIQGSQEKLIRLIRNELREMSIQSDYSDTDILNYRFTFKKA